jgi:hypothetical protein
MALISGVISTTVGWVGGRHSWEGIVSISVSLDGAGGSLGVFLVLGFLDIYEPGLYLSLWMPQGV